MEAHNLQPMAVPYRALRLVNTKNMEREEWLNIASEALVVLMRQRPLA